MRLRLALRSLLVGLIFSVPSNATDATTRPEHWIGSWATAPQASLPQNVATFSNQTVRLIVHTSVGGSKVRIRLSNAYGNEPLLIGAAHIGRAVKGTSSIRAGSDRALTFQGKTRVSVAPGSFVISDAVLLDTPPLSDIAISLFFPNETHATTSHLLAQQSSYLATAPGDFTASLSFPKASALSDWPFLCGVDVVADGESATIVVFGDSTVDGDGSTVDANRRWPDAIAERLQRDAKTRPLGLLNEGIIGNRLLQGSPQATEFGRALGDAGLSRFTRDALDQSGVETVIVRIGINDIGFPGSLDPKAKPVSADELIAGYQKVIAAAHSRHVRIIATTVGPFEGAKVGENYYTPEKERVRQSVNEWLRKQDLFDGMIDLDRVLRDPAHPSRLRPAYDSGDHLHPNDKGYAASAEAVDLQLLAAAVSLRTKP